MITQPNKPLYMQTLRMGGSSQFHNEFCRNWLQSTGARSEWWNALARILLSTCLLCGLDTFVPKTIFRHPTFAWEIAERWNNLGRRRRGVHMGKGGRAGMGQSLPPRSFHDRSRDRKSAHESAKKIKNLKNSARQ